MEYKIGRHIARITKPEHQDTEINWGSLNFMISQTPSENLKYLHFNNRGNNEKAIKIYNIYIIHFNNRGNNDISFLLLIIHSFF
jgi:hypothetical protein